jgi:serine/threonine-protein kinase
VALEHYKTQVLLLHSQQSTLDILSTGFNDRYSVHCATTGSEALSTLGVTPIHVIVSAQDLPGMSGLEALREAKKRSPDTIGILLAGRDQSDGLEALVGDKEVFQIVRGEITPEALRSLIDNATKRARLIALSESANDTAANVDEPMGEHIVMETSENGATIISDGTGTLPTLKPHKIQIGADIGTRGVDILVLTKDEEFLATVKDSARGLHKLHHAATPAQAEAFFKGNKIGVLVTDAAMVGSNIEVLTQKFRTYVPRLVAIVAGRRDDGELLMDLINRGQVYRFLLKPVSPGRARLAIEASVKHHLEAPEKAFKPAGGNAAAAPKSAAPVRPQPKAVPRPQPKVATRPEAKQPPPKVAAVPAPGRKAPATQRRTPTISGSPVAPIEAGLDDAFGNDSTFTETVTGIAASISKSLAGGLRKSPDPATEPALETNASATPGFTSVLRTPKFMAASAAVLLVLVAGFWLISGPDTEDSMYDPAISAGADEQASGNEPVTRIVESELPTQTTPAPAPSQALPNYADLLDEARIARDAGELIRPSGASAVELYIAAREAAPGDVVIASELAEVLDRVLGVAESALLAQDAAEAEAAIGMVRFAAPDNPRIPFLDAQLAQLHFRSALEDARAAIRDRRFEDAAINIAKAQAVIGVETAEAGLLAEELARARSEQRVDEVLAQAATRLEEDKLTSPANDNARYYYELALSNDPRNTAAQQGLIIIASKLVLKARAAIDNGQLDQAAKLLGDATALDPDNSELASSTLALQSARQVQADAARRAEQERQAAIERQAAAERQAEAERLAELERQAAERRQAEVAAAAAAAAAAPGSATGPPATAAGATQEQPLQRPDPASDEASPGAADAGSETAVTEPALALSATPQDDSPVTAQQDAAVGNASSASAEPVLPEMVGVNTLNRTRYIAPKYPRNAMRREITGFVDVSLTVGSDGRVYNVTVLNADPGGTFDAAAIEAVQQWRFEPVVENGQVVEKRTAVRMAFEIQ